jgi:hypothetical protein
LNPKIKERLLKILRTMENIYSKIWADRKYTGEVRIEMAMNRCLNSIEDLKKMETLPSDIKRVALEYAWHVYMDLQEFQAPIERQDIHSKKREVSLNVYLKQIKVIENKQESVQYGMFSGGTGYRSVNWDTEYWMAENKAHAPINEYWDEKEARKKRPVRVYTKEELKKFL